MMERYEKTTSPDERGYAVFRRVRDGKTATAKTTWFKAAPDGDGFVARSRVKALRLSGLKWE